MWVEILCGLVFYKLFRSFILTPDAAPDVDSADSDLSFAIASRLEKTHGGRAFVGLRIPDPETGARCHVDLVLVTRKEVVVVAVRNLSGFVEAGRDGSWVCIRDSKHRPETHPDPVSEIHKQVEILESYLEQRGVPLPKGHLIGKVVLPNPNCRIAHSLSIQPEVISFDEWKDLKAESGYRFSNWIKDAIHGAKGETQDNLYQKLHFILSTAPMWDRLEIKGDRNILGEFMEFKGNQDDMQALRHVKRSKVGRIIIQKPSMFGLGRSRVSLLYSPRDYRSEGTSSLEWTEVAVKPSTEVLFQPLNSKKARKFKLTSIVSITLSA